VCESPIACRMDALGASGRARHAALIAELTSTGPAVEELPEGFAFRFPSRPFLFLRVAEWIGLERECCPFLEIRLDLEYSPQSMRVTVTGPPGTKDLLRAELPLAVAAGEGK
jgi:hypothetical protein